MVYFIHFRAVGDPVHLAQSAAAAVSATATPLPQTMPMHPSTPLDSAALGQALGGDAMVGSDGVVTVTIPRQNNFTLGGVPTQSTPGWRPRSRSNPSPVGRPLWPPTSR